MSVYAPQRRTRQWAIFWAVAICGGPVIVLTAGLVLYGLARMMGGAP